MQLSSPSKLVGWSSEAEPFEWRWVVTAFARSWTDRVDFRHPEAAGRCRPRAA